MKSVYLNVTKVSNYTFGSEVVGFASKFQNGIAYYVADFGNDTIVMFDKDWNYDKYETYEATRNIIRLGNYLYTLLANRIDKLDFNLNVVNSSSNLVLTRRLLYVPTCNCFYVSNILTIDIFDINLTYLESVSLNGSSPFALRFFNEKVYVSTYNNSVLILQDKKIVDKIINICNATIVYYMFMDHTNHLAMSCNKTFHLYNPNQVKQTSYVPVDSCISKFFGFDLSGRFFILCSIVGRMIVYN